MRSRQAGRAWLAAALALLASGAGAHDARRWDFEGAAVPCESMPADPVQAAAWRTEEVGDAASGRHVLTAAPPGDTRAGAALCLVAPADPDLAVTVRLRPAPGSTSQAAGIVLRARGRDAYYVARADASEGHVRIDAVQDGRSVPVASGEATMSAGTWHELRVDAIGSHFVVHVDGVHVAEADDARIVRAGHVGLWTNGGMAFDDLTVEPPAAGMSDLNRELVELRARMAALERRSTEPVTGPSPAPTAAPDLGAKTVYRSADGRTTLRFDGTVQADARLVRSGMGDTGTFAIRRANAGLEGLWNGLAEYRFQIEVSSLEASTAFSPRRLAMHNAYVGLVLSPKLILRAGQFKTPFETEYTTLSDRNLDLAERSWIQRVIPGRDVGVMASGELLAGRLDWGLALFNGATGESLGKNALDTNTGKDVGGMLRVRPFGGARHALAHLQLGGGFTRGDANGDVLGSIVSNETGVNVLAFASDARGGARRRRWAAETYWWHGPVSLKAALATLDTDVVRGTHAGSVRLRAYQLSGSWLLTGETKSLGRITPRRSFDWKARRFGSLEIAARLSGYESRNAFEGAASERFADPGFGTDEVRSLAVGVVWRPLSTTRVLVDYVHESYAQSFRRSGRSEADDSARAVLTRLQVDF